VNVPNYIEPMEVLPINDLKIALSAIGNTDNIMQSTFRLIPYGRQHKAHHLLNKNSSVDLNELLNLKNAQTEAQPNLGAASYSITINKTLSTVLPNIKGQIAVKAELQLFHLFRSVDKTSCNSSKEIQRYTLSN
jgi:hypothetical protein